MKKIILFAAFIAAVSFTANAQTVSQKVEKAEKTATIQKNKAKATANKSMCCKDAKTADAKACAKEGQKACTEAKTECKNASKDAKACSKECKAECKKACKNAKVASKDAKACKKECQKVKKEVKG